MNLTALILSVALLATGAFAQTDLSKAVPPTPAKPTVSGSLTAITPVAPQKNTSTPGKTMPTETPKPITFDPAVSKPTTVGVPSTGNTGTTNWSGAPPSAWDTNTAPSPWRTAPAPHNPWK